MSRLRGAERQAEKLEKLKEERRKLKGDRGALIPNKQTCTGNTPESGDNSTFTCESNAKALRGFVEFC